VKLVEYWVVSKWLSSKKGAVSSEVTFRRPGRSDWP